MIIILNVLLLREHYADISTLHSCISAAFPRAYDTDRFRSQEKLQGKLSKSITYLHTKAMKCSTKAPTQICGRCFHTNKSERYKDRLMCNRNPFYLPNSVLLKYFYIISKLDRILASSVDKHCRADLQRANLEIREDNQNTPSGLKLTKNKLRK